MDQGALTGVVFLDLKKAFDTVNHNKLIEKLVMYGVSETSVMWFYNYSNGRKHHAKVNGIVSDCRVTTCGVPQVSILGPLPFSIYVNDLSNYLPDLRVIPRARDGNMFVITTH